MAEKIVIKGRLEFEGTVEAFEALNQALSRGSGRLSADNGGGDPTGVWTRSPDLILGRKRIQAFAQDKPAIQVTRSVTGGIQNPHLHMTDRVVLLDREEFKEFVGEVADGLAKQLAEKGDYRETVKTINSLSVPNKK